MKPLRKPFKYSFHNLTLIIAGMNVLMYMFLHTYPQARVYLAMNPVLVIKGPFVWQCFTYMFVHADLNHLFVNMLSLVMFGMAVEKGLGSREFLLLYLITGFMSGIISLALYCITGMWMVSLVGASGAIFGLLLAYAVMYPRSRIFLFYILPVPAPLMIILYAGYELYSSIFATGGSVAHATHLAGFFVTWVYFVVRLGVNPIAVWKKARIS